MITLLGKNVNVLWPKGLACLAAYGLESDSRAGRVRVAESPVMSVYEKPEQRVLFDPLRDANPFFHLMESLWMLAGREDAAFLNRYVGNFGERFGEDNLYIHGAYGDRWRNALGVDQLDAVVSKLRANPEDRQAVIQMWDGSNRSVMPIDDIGCNDLLGTFKDRPCNTHIYLRVRDSKDMAAAGGILVNSKKLDLTVLCRSNDIVWGAYGANAVHFSMLQEYLAGRIGVGMGRMYQFSNNYHGYVDVLDKFFQRGPGGVWADPYTVDETLWTLPIGSNWEKWDDDLSLFMDWHDNVLWQGKSEDIIYANPWFARTATYVARANYLWKQGEKRGALGTALHIDAPDWRAACTSWMQRRMQG